MFHQTRLPAPPVGDAPSETWAAARAAYLGGLSAGEVCERFDLGVSTFRSKAREEGWRRADQPDPGAVGADDADLAMLDGDEARDAAGMADLTFRQARRATLQGRAAEAERWSRLHRTWTALAAAESAARERRRRQNQSPEDEVAEQLARSAHDRRVRELHAAADRCEAETPAPSPSQLAGALDDLHHLHGAAPEVDSSDPAPRPRNRAERRA